MSGANYVLTTAEAEALGLAGSSGINGYVGFSSSFAFAYDDSGGVPPGEYDFFGVVAHEISEVMGRSMMDGPSYSRLTCSTVRRRAFATSRARRQDISLRTAEQPISTISTPIPAATLATGPQARETIPI